MRYEDNDVRFVLDQHAKFGFYTATHSYNCPLLDMQLHSATLSRLGAKVILLLLLNTA